MVTASNTPVNAHWLDSNRFWRHTCETPKTQNVFVEAELAMEVVTCYLCPKCGQRHDEMFFRRQIRPEERCLWGHHDEVYTCCGAAVVPGDPDPWDLVPVDRDIAAVAPVFLEYATARRLSLDILTKFYLLLIATIQRANRAERAQLSRLYPVTVRAYEEWRQDTRAFYIKYGVITNNAETGQNLRIGISYDPNEDEATEAEAEDEDENDMKMDLDLGFNDNSH